jgi:hypothetical protein
MLRHVETQLQMLENELKNTKSKSLSTNAVDYFFDVMMDEEYVFSSTNFMYSLKLSITL